MNEFMGALKPQSKGPAYINTVIGTLAVDGWAVTCGTARRRLSELRPPPSPLPNVTAHPSPPVYQLHIIRCGVIIVSAGIKRVKVHLLNKLFTY